MDALGHAARTTRARGGPDLDTCGTLIQFSIGRELPVDRIVVERDPRAVAQGAHVLYTDAWTSMGQEAETERRRVAFGAYRIDDALLAVAPAEAFVMHCLPAHRGEEISDAVMDGPRSAVFDQAENRLHVQNALLASILGT